MENSLGTLLHSGVFSNTHRPNPSPHHTQKSWTRVSGTDLEFFSQFQLCIGWGEGEMEEYFEKDALFYEGTQNREKNMNTALLSQGRLSMIVPYSRYKFSSSFLKLPVTFPDLEFNIFRTCSLRTLKQRRRLRHRERKE